MNKGFFFEENIEVKKEKKIKKLGKKLKKLSKKEIDFCEKCNLYKNCLSPKMQFSGKGKKEILIIGEAPGKEEDIQGIQFIGQSGQLLRKKFKKFNVDFNEDCWITNSIICRPENNKTPSIAQVNYCRKNLKETIEKLKPKKILTFGKIALQGLIGDKISVTSINQWVGWQIPDQDYKCFIYPNFHPAYLLRNQDEVLERKFDEYLYNALNFDKKFKIYNNYNNYVFILKDRNKILNFLQSIKDNDIVTFDYETNSLRSQYENSKIICISIGIKNKSYAFMIDNDEEIILELKNIFENENIKKIAHNINFENSWTRLIFKCNIKNWYWDTMVCAHVLDNRTGITGLKFQTYIHFGVIGYDNNISSFLKSETQYNNIENADKEQLLLYCGIDSYFTYELFFLQKKQLDNHLQKGFNFYIEGLRSLVDIHLNGIKFDNKVYEKNYGILTKKINELHNKIMDSKEVGLLENKNDFNYDSVKQLRELLFDVCKWKSKGKTKTNLYSVDANTLKLFDKRLTNNILEKRSLTKIRDTYLQQFKREEINGCLYPIFNLHTVSSYRPSTSYPNMANVPKRNEEAKKLIRETIIPRHDGLLEIDYSGIEVMVAACYTQDTNLINYINDENTDMHRDTAADIFCIKKEEVTKELRYIAKNKFVFPQFYGDYYVNCCENIWESLEDKFILFAKGFTTKQKFEKHIQKVEDIFWNVRFKEYNEWKKQNYNFYLKNGYIEFKTGFRATDIMRRNQVNNLAFQGSAFHILLFSLNRINSYLKENNYKTKIINQVYDCIVFDYVQKEWEELRPIIKKIMLEDVRKYFNWINVPLKAEITYYKKNWADEIKSENL